MEAMPATLRFEKLALAGGAVFFLTFAALFAYTNNYLLIAAPFVTLFAAWMVLNWKSVYWLLIFCIPLSIDLNLINGRLATTVPDEQIMWALMLLFIFLFFGRKKLFPEWFTRNPITLVLFLQLIWLVVAVLFTEDFFLSGKYFIAQMWFAVSFIAFPPLVFRKKTDFKKAFVLFSIPLVAHAIFAFAWHYTHNFGYLESNIVVRPFYMNHVDHSTVLSMFFPLLLVAFQLSKGKKIQRWLLLAVISFFIPAIYVAGARAAILAVMFAFGINFAIRKRLANYVMPTFYTLVIVAVCWLVNNNKYYDLRPDMKFTATQESFSETVKAMFSGTDMSSMERFYRWIAAARMSEEHPLTGVGPNNFYDYYKNYSVTAFKTWVSRNEERSTTHNYFLFMLVEQGYPAMILYAILMIVIFAQAQRMYHTIRDPFYKKATMGLTMVLAAGFINNFFSELIITHKIGALFYIPLTLLIVIKHLAKVEDQKSLLHPA